MCEDDRHNACSIDLQRNVLTYTAILFVSYHSLGILNRNFPDTLNKGDTHLMSILDEIAALVASTRYKLRFLK